MESRQPEFRAGDGGADRMKDDEGLQTLQNYEFTFDPGTLLGSGLIVPDVGEPQL